MKTSLTRRMAVDYAEMIALTLWKFRRWKRASVHEVRASVKVVNKGTFLFTHQVTRRRDVKVPV